MTKNYLFTTHPHLRDEFDFKKNREEYPDLNFEKITTRSNRKFWWKCTKSGHSWLTTPEKRTNRNFGCPSCKGFKTRMLFDQYPELRDEFDWERNRAEYPDLDFEKLTVGSNYKMYWKCGNHLWEPYPQVIRNKTISKQKCGYCSSRLVLKGFNDCWTTAPEIAKRLIDPHLGYLYTKWSSKRTKFSCVRGHIVSSTFANMSTAGENSCLACLSDAIVGINDLWNTCPEAAVQLLDQTEGYKYMKGSNCKTWFLYPKGHIRCTSINSVSSGCGCLKCCNTQISMVEIRMSLILDNKLGNNIDPKHTHKLPIKSKSNRPVVVDYFVKLNNIKLVVEYDGKYYHENKSGIERDTTKTNLLLDNNYTVVRIREDNLAPLEINHPHLLQIPCNYHVSDDKNLLQCIDKIVTWIERLDYLSGEW